MLAQKNKNQLDDFFKNSFEDAEIKPADQMWLGLETKMLNTQAERDKKKILFLRWLLVASVLLFIVFGAFYILNQSNQSIVSDINKEKNNLIQTKKNSSTKELQIKNENDKNLNKEENYSAVNSEQGLISDKQKENIKLLNHTKNQLLPKQNLKQNTESQHQPVTINNKQATNHKLQTTNHKPQITNHKQVITKEQQAESTTNQQQIASDKLQPSKNIKTPEVKNIITTDSAIAQTINQDLVDNTSINDSIHNTSDTLQVNQLVAELIQNENKKEMEESISPDFKKWQIGINFSPDYCYRTLKNDDGSEFSNFVIASRNENEIAKFGYTTGLNMIFNLKKNIGIEAGVQFSKKGYQTIMQELTYGDFIDSTGFISNAAVNPPPLSPSTPVITNAKFIYNYYYLDIPIKVNFIFGKRKIRFICSGGLATNIFIRETTTSILNYDDGTTKKNTLTATDNYSKLNISPLISAGIDWRLNNKNAIRIEPHFKYGVLKIINTPVTGYLWNAGINIGYYFGVK